VYLNDWFGSRGLIGDISDDRYSILPRSETGRRLFRKRQKREQRRAENPATTLAEEVNEYKGTMSVDELLAFINSAKVPSESPSSKAPNSTPSKKDRNIRRKKKQAGDPSEDSDAASVSTMDTSSCSGYEAAASVESIADTEIEVSQPTTVSGEHISSHEGVRNMDGEMTANDDDRFVVVQKKKKVRQPVSQLSQMQEVNRRLAFSSVASTQAVHRQPPPPRVARGNETCKVDDVVSLKSDTDSMASYPRDNYSKTASIRCSSPDFPDLVMQGCAVPGRRNSTGNVCDSVATNEKLPSYAIVAAGGMRPNQAVDVEWQVGASTSSANQECHSNSSMSVEDDSSSKMLSENFCNTLSQIQVDYDNSEPSTPTGYCSADSHSVVSDDLAKELNDVKLQNAAKRLHLDSATAVPVSTSDCVGNLVDRKIMLGCYRKTKLSASPVVFLDIANEHRPVRGNLGVSFGFDGAENVCSVAQSECSSSESGFSDCTVHTDTDKISSVASTDSATSPVDQQDFTSTETVPTSVVQTVTVGHCRPIVPFHATTGHQSCSHTPVGIVPPIPQVDRPAEPVDQDTAKDSKQDIMRSVIGSAVPKDDILRRELVSADKRFPNEKSLSANAVSVAVSSHSTVCSVPAGSFNLLTAQIYLYSGGT